MIGTRGHDIGFANPGELAELMLNEGFRTVQLVPWKSFPDWSDLPGSLSSDRVSAVRSAFDSRGLRIALLGSYFNMLDHDRKRLDGSICRFKEYLSFAGEFGCLFVGTETGSYNPDMSFHPDNHGEKAFRTVLGIVRELVQEAESCGSAVAVEAVHNYVIHDPQSMKRLIDEVASDSLQVILDPVNLLHNGNFNEAANLVEQYFSLFGDRIMLIHAKDFQVAGEGILTVPLGSGIMDFKQLFTVMARYKSKADIIIEDFQGKELTAGRQYIQDILDGIQKI